MLYDVDGNERQRSLQVFDRFFDGLTGRGIYVDRSDISRGYAIYIFNLDPDLSESTQFSLLKSGEMSLNVRPGTSLTESATCILYAERFGLLEFDETRNVNIS